MYRLLVPCLLLALVTVSLAAGTPGSLDATFDGDGLWAMDFGFEERAWSVAVQPDGRLVAVGEMRHATGPDPSDEVIDWGVVRLDADGGLDTGFGSSGVASPLALDQHGLALDVAIDGDGKIVVAGYQQVAVETTSGKGKNQKTTISIVQQLALARLLPDGSPDTSFGVNGVVLTDVPGTDYPQATASSVVLLPDGDILVAGEATITQSSGKGRDRQAVTSAAVLLARYGSDGTLDAGFGVGGILVDDFSTGNDAVQLRGLGVQSDGRIVVAGRAGFLRRYETGGGLDTSFGSGGMVTAPAGDGYLGGLTVDGQDRILVAGYREYAANDRDGLVARFGASGSADWTYLTSSPDSIEFRGVAVDASGRIVAGGDLVNGTVRDGIVVRLLTDGSEDPGFQGALTTPGDQGLDLIADVAVDGDDNVLLAGGIGVANTGILDWFLARYAGN